MKSLFLVLSVFLLGSFSEGPDPKALTFEQIEAHVESVLKLKDSRKLTMHEAEGLTAWGSVSSFWGKNDLLIIESVHKGEAGFKAMTLFLNKGDICRIAVSTHFANWEQYERDHGNEPYDESKLTYTDENFDYTLGKEVTFRIPKNGILTVEVFDQKNFDELLGSAKSLQRFVEESDL